MEFPQSRFWHIMRMAIFIIAASLLGAFAVMFLWNSILPSLVHVGMINYWQSLGLLVLSRLLFGSGGGWRGGHDHRRGHEWLAKWKGMTKEERIAFKEEWKKRKS